MKTALDVINEILLSGDELKALRLAAKISKHGLGEQCDAIQKGWSAHTRPDFYRSIGKNPDELVQSGIKALRKRCSLLEKVK